MIQLDKALSSRRGWPVGPGVVYSPHQSALLTASPQGEALGAVSTSETNLNLTKECDFMKKLVAVVLVLVFLLSLVGCSDTKRETVMFNGQTFDKADLSQETIEWLEWYNGLTEDEQLAVDFIPADLNK